MNAAVRCPDPVAHAPFGGIPGLIWGYRFGADGSAVALDHAVDAGILSAVRAPGEWLWLHFAQTDSRFAHAIGDLGLPARASHLLLAHDDHLCLHLEGDTAFGVLADWHHEIEDEFASSTHSREGFNEERGIGRLRFVLTEGLVISTRRAPLHSVRIMRERLGSGVCVDTAARMLESIIEQFASSVALVGRELADALDEIEDRVLAERIGDERRDLGRVRRRAVRVHRPLKALRRVIRQFERRHEQRSSHEFIAIAARLLQRFDELDSEIVELEERARLLHDEVAAKLTDQTNRQLYLLSILSALFLPPTLVVGVFGMNTKGLPLTENPQGFVIAMIFCVAASAIVYGLLRRLGVR